MGGPGCAQAQIERWPNPVQIHENNININEFLFHLFISGGPPDIPRPTPH